MTATCIRNHYRSIRLHTSAVADIERKSKVKLALDEDSGVISSSAPPSVRNTRHLELSLASQIYVRREN